MRKDLICKILDGVSEWTNGCYKCMFDTAFLYKLALMDEKELKIYLDNERYKTFFQNHKNKLIHDIG